MRADSVSTPVSCNSAVEKCGWFTSVHRTRIGSPYVIASMNEACRAGAKIVVGYEASGGFLFNSNVTPRGKTLLALPTRDAVIVILGILLSAKQRRMKISQLLAELPSRYTASDRLENFPTARSCFILKKFSSGDHTSDYAAIESVFGSLCGKVLEIDCTDGLRITFTNEEVIHLRPSGNAPELRCYTESAARDRSMALRAEVLNIIRQLAADS